MSDPMDDLLGAIDDALARKGLSDAAASMLAVGNYALIKNLRASRATKPADRRTNFHALQKLADVLGLECYFGPPRDTAPVAQVVLDGADFASIPRIDAALAAGAGAENHSDAVIETLAFRRDWLNKNHVSPAAARLVRVAGDSMAPTLLDGDMVMIDTSRTSVRSGRVYAFRDHGETRVKRIELADEQTVILRSDNTGHPVEIRKVGQDDDFQILGQVVWSGHTWK